MSERRGRQTGSRSSGPAQKQSLVQTCLLRRQPRMSHNQSHSGLQNCVPWKFREVSYLWKISCSLVSRHCGNQTTTPNTHAPSQTLFSIPPYSKPPAPLCSVVKMPRAKMEGGTSAQAPNSFQLLNRDTFCALFLTKGLHYVLIKTLMYCPTKKSRYTAVTLSL